MLLTNGIAREAVFAGDPSRRIRGRQRGRWKLQGTLETMQRGGWMAPPRQQPAPAVAADPAARLRELAALKDAGVLTQDEFSAGKAKLLGG